MLLLSLLKEPTGYPSKVQVTFQNSAFVAFQWKELECYEENGPITGYQYRIYYDHTHYNKGKVNRNTTRLTVPKTNVQSFSVAAINKAGIGPHCPPVSVPNFFEGGAKCKKGFYAL